MELLESSMKKYLFYIAQNYAFEVLRPLQKTIIDRGDEVKWFVESNDVNNAFFKSNEQVLSSVEAIIDYNPYAIFVPGNLVPAFLPGLKVGIFHGFVGFKTRRKDNLNYHFIIRDCFDLYCTHGDSSTLTFQELAEKHKHFKVIETGYCKMDPYFNGSHQVSKKKNKPIVLFSSTFSPRMTQAPLLLEHIKRLSKDTKWHWQVTFHPKMDKSIVDAYKAIQHENLSFIETDQLAPYLVNADLMVGDNSSMITDFLLLQKPVVTVNNQSPKDYLHNITDPTKLESAIEYGLTQPAILMNAIRSFAEETHPYIDGLSSSRVLDAVEEAVRTLDTLAPKPTSFIRNFKQRKRLSYWKF
jgi:hypothetical protein